ncbi:MAG: translocation/assembly module TamB [Bacteroidetes bacterium]|nr:translocation/assembly module TamB [Fibrella sp.]
MRRLLSILIQTLLYGLLVGGLVLVSVVIGLQMPAVQTKVVQKLADYASRKMRFPISIGYVSLKWFDTLTLEDVRVRDRHNEPMITVKRLEVTYDLSLRTLWDSTAHSPRLNGVLLYQPDVRLIRNGVDGETNIEEFIARIEELTGDPNAPHSDVHTPFVIPKATIADGTFTLTDPREPPVTNRNRFDQDHFTIDHVNGNVKNFTLLGDSIYANVSRLRGIDRHSTLRLHRLDTRFLYCNTKLQLADLYARINTSTIRNELVFTYRHPRAFSHFNSQVTMRARLRGTVITSTDLGYFSDYIRDLRDVWALTTDFRGTVENFKLSRTDLRFGPGGRNRLAGDISFRGLPDIDRTTVNFGFSPSTVNMADLRQYYPDADFNNTIRPFGTVAFNADFVGAFDNFRTVGTFNTALGGVAGDLNLKLATKRTETMYTANVKADKFALGQLLGQPALFQSLDGEGRISGRGTSLNTADLDVNAQLSRFGLNGYDYRNLTVLGNLQKAFFNGKVSVRDENMALDVDGEFDLRGPRSHFDGNGELDHANLRALKLVNDSLTISTRFDVSLDGNSIDELVGEARFRRGVVMLSKRRLAIDTLTLNSTISPAGSRALDIDSEFLTAQLQGNFEPDRTLTDLNRLLTEYNLYFIGDAARRTAYYRQKLARTALPNRYSIDYTVDLKTADSLLAFLYPTGYVAPGTRVEGRFTVDNTSFLTATAQTDSLRLGNLSFGKSDLDLTTSKFTNGEAVLASVVINSARQQYDHLAPTENWQAEASWDVDHIEFTSSIRQFNSSNRANVSGELRFKGDAIDLTFRQSDFRILDKDWTLNPASLLRKVGSDITVRNVSVSNGAQLVAASGQVSTDSLATLRIDARDFRLETLNPVLNTSLSGITNGTFTLSRLYQTPIVESELSVRDLALGTFRIGDVRGTGTWDPRTERLNVDTRVSRDNRDVLTLTGTYDPRKKANPFDMRADFSQASLGILEPFATGLFSGIAGSASGIVSVKGSLSRPVLTGFLDVTGGRLTVDYLKTGFTFDDRVDFADGEITSKKLVLRDPSGNTATVRGGVYYEGFRYFQLNFDADLSNIRVLNTTARDNEMFYGTAFVTGKGELFGPLNNLTIKANVRSNKGTQIYIPFDGATSVSSEEYIRFVSRKPAVKTDSAKTSDRRTEVDLSGIAMDFNLDITPDAYCEIQLDRQTGDIIKAYGEGRIAMRVDTKGEFSMTGNYEIQQGDYTFTFQNLINKRFKIQPNSRITWTGDPYSALLDVTAAYTQYTSLGALIPTSTSTDKSRRYPVDLLIKLTGQLTLPDIKFDLKVKEYPSSAEFRQYVTAFENRIQTNEQELTRQVSSVLIFNQLLPEGSGLLDGENTFTTGAANSVSELLSNRISQLASSLDKNLDVGVSLNTLGSGTANENLLNNLQLRFSYRFLNDRFRISRDGGFTYGQNQTSAASLLGEWTLEYWIRPDGRLRAKVYNRNQQSLLSQLSTFNNTALTTGGGLSLLYTRSFNRIFGGSRATPGLTITPDVPSALTQGK